MHTILIIKKYKPKPQWAITYNYQNVYYQADKQYQNTNTRERDIHIWIYFCLECKLFSHYGKQLKFPQLRIELLYHQAVSTQIYPKKMKWVHRRNICPLCSLQLCSEQPRRGVLPLWLHRWTWKMPLQGRWNSLTWEIENQSHGCTE